MLIYGKQQKKTRPYGVIRPYLISLIRFSCNFNFKTAFFFYFCLSKKITITEMVLNLFRPSATT